MTHDNNRRQAMNFKHALLTAALLTSAAAHAQLVVGVSWSNFQRSETHV